MERLYPVFLKLVQTPCLVVGGGKVATRKVERLIQVGALVTVVSPGISQKIRELADQGRVTLIEREASPEDVKGFAFVFCATCQSEVNHTLAEVALKSGAQVNVADSPDLSSFYLPALVERGKLQIAISTSGASPAMARQVRLDLEESFGPEYELVMEVEEYLRGLILETVSPGERPQLFRRLAKTLPAICKNVESPQELRGELTKNFSLDMTKNFEQLIAPYFR